MIVSTRVPHESAVLEAIRQFGLDLQVIFNKGAVMILPAGHNKASGLAAALDTAHYQFCVIDPEGDYGISMEWLSWDNLTGHPPLKKLWVY